MDIYELIKTRRSVRAYQDKPIPEEVLNRIMDGTRMAPSAANRQPWKFVIVKNPERRRQMALACAGQMFIAEAPVVIAAVALQPERVMSCQVPTYAVDLSIAVTHIILAAAYEGLGTCWIGDFSQDRVSKVIELPSQYKVVAVLPLGYPADQPVMKSRKSLESIICSDRFSM